MGDSGGPIFLQNQNGRHSLAGIISAGDGCNQNWPGIFTKTSAYNDWIYHITGGLVPVNTQVEDIKDWRIHEQIDSNPRAEVKNLSWEKDSRNLASATSLESSSNQIFCRRLLIFVVLSWLKKLV